MIRHPRHRVILVQEGCSSVGQQPLWNVIRYACGISAASINHLLGIPGGWSEGSLAEGGPVESNERYYRRRAVEERMAAQRAITDTAKAWHAKLAEDFAQRAMASTVAIQSAVAS
jgi:hypothetical protein